MLTSPRPDAPYEMIAEALGGRLLRRWALEGGVSAEVQALEVARPDGTIDRVVVRCHGAAAGKAPDPGVLSIEHGVSHALADAGLCVPRPLALDVSETVLPMPYLVIPFVDGTPDPRDLRTGLGAMADFLAQLHDLDPTALDLPTSLSRRDDPVPSILASLPDGLAAIRHRLPTEAPSTASRGCLLHGDFWPGNIIWRGDRIAAVIDWEDTAVGDPLSDVAGSRLELLWKHGSDAMGAFTNLYLRARGGSADPRALALWELHVGTGALASMDRWGLDAAVVACMRAETHGFLRRAAASL